MINVNKELFQNFLDNKIVINCQTEDEAIKFLKYCDSQELIWCTLKNLSGDNKWDHHKEETCYRCKNNEITYSPKYYYMNIKKMECKNIITYKELLKKSNTYTGWQILKMIDEGQLKEDMKIIWHNGEDIHREEFVLRNDRCLYSTKYHKEANISYFIHAIGQGYFTIKEKEYVKFDEARNSGKRFKYKEWNEYRYVGKVLYELSKRDNNTINRLMNEKAWEVKN